MRARQADHTPLINACPPGKFIFPGGGVEGRESPSGAAQREAMEEAGVLGRVGPRLDDFVDDASRTRTATFVLFVDEELDVWEE